MTTVDRELWRSVRLAAYWVLTSDCEVRRRHRVRCERERERSDDGGGGHASIYRAAAAARRTCTMTARAEDHSIRMYRRPPGIKPVSSRWSHGLVRGLPPKPRRVVKAPARHNRRRGLSTRPTHTHTHTNNTHTTVHTSSHLHLAATMTVVDTSYMYNNVTRQKYSRTVAIALCRVCVYRDKTSSPENSKLIEG